MPKPLWCMLPHKAQLLDQAVEQSLLNSELAISSRSSLAVDAPEDSIVVTVLRRLPWASEPSESSAPVDDERTISHLGARLDSLSPLDHLSSEASRRVEGIFELLPDNTYDDSDSGALLHSPLSIQIRMPSFGPSEAVSSPSLKNSGGDWAQDEADMQGSGGVTSAAGPRLDRTSDAEQEQDSNTVYSHECEDNQEDHANTEDDDRPPSRITHNDVHDPALAAGLQNYRITYSRKVYEEPVSPRGHPDPVNLTRHAEEPKETAKSSLGSHFNSA
ncbi:MAG: hypothetical protein LQ340_004138 [Diploschistes diacapsis]|nr:MAG: hypothetical protein LQ340_004138 [Diploschistes diacapsis]